MYPHEPKKPPCAKCIHCIYLARMETNIQKWGNSLGVRLPKHITENRSLKVGSRVVVSETEKGIVITAVKKTRRTLGEMLKDVTKSNLHRETDWGGSVGNEVW